MKTPITLRALTISAAAFAALSVSGSASAAQPQSIMDIVRSNAPAVAAVIDTVVGNTPSSNAAPQAAASSSASNAPAAAGSAAPVNAAKSPTLPAQASAAAQGNLPAQSGGGAAQVTLPAQASNTATSRVGSQGALASSAPRAGVTNPTAVEAISNHRPAPDSELPRHAKSGSGVVGNLDPKALSAKEVSLTLPDGRVITAKVQRNVSDIAKGVQSWVGTFADQPGSMLVLTTFKGSTSGFATYGAETWEIVPSKAGGFLLYSVDEGKFPKTEPTLHGSTTSLDVASSTSSTTGTASMDATGDYVQTVLVVYTPASKARWGQATLESMIQSAVQAANQAYQNSQVGVTLNMVGLQEIQYTETGDIATSAYDLKGTTDGKMDTVHTLRDSAGADMVALISEDSNACGVAFTMRSVSTSHASSAFGVVNSGCLSQHSFAHELGHIQGNQHDRASTSNTGAFAYSYGYRVCDKTDGTGFRDVMSYACNGAPRVTQFSNPSVYYNGYATGIAYETDPANSADTARSMNNTAATVAAFRGTTTSTSGSTAAPAAPSSLTAAAVSSSSVSLTWKDNATNETGLKVERSSDGVTFTEIAALGASTTGYSDTGLTSRTAYYYRVRAYNSAGNSGYSNTASVTTQDTPPSQPGSVAALNVGDGSAAVNWVDNSTNETGFEVRRETWDANKSVWTSAKIVASVPTGTASIVDRSGNGIYRYSVRAVNSGGASGYAGPAQTTVTGGSVSKGKKPTK
jgi:hypothetical protein